MEVEEQAIANYWSKLDATLIHLTFDNTEFPTAIVLRSIVPVAPELCCK